MVTGSVYTVVMTAKGEEWDKKEQESWEEGKKSLDRCSYWHDFWIIVIMGMSILMSQR